MLMVTNSLVIPIIIVEYESIVWSEYQGGIID